MVVVSFTLMVEADTIASLINILLVLIAVINRNTVNIGILAVAMSMAAQMTMDLLQLIVEWTSE